MFILVLNVGENVVVETSESSGMKTVYFRRMLAGVLIPLSGMLVVTPAVADLVLNFDNDRPDASTVPAYITFTGALPGQFAATIVGTRTQVLEGVSYSLQSLSSGVDVTEYESGRVFVSLGSPLTSLSAGNQYSPNFTAPTIANVANPNFLTRLDKYEITYTPASYTPQGTFVPANGGANLSATDFFGIPLQLQTTGGAQSKTLTWNYTNNVNTAAVFHALGALENFQTDSVANTLGAIVANGANGVTINTPAGPLNGVVRIISPSSTNQPGTGSSTPYPDIGAYATHIQTNQISANIAGQNGQFTPNQGPFQNYNMTGTISNGTTPIDGIVYPRGELVLFGNVTKPSGVGTNQLTVTVSQANLQSFAIYGANPAYKVTVGTDANKVVQKIVADYFSGLNFGFIGSPVNNPNKPGTTIGSSPSWTWYGNKPIPDAAHPPAPVPALPLSDAYEAAQPTQPGFYNAYASYLNNSSAPVTDAYGFPYTDRLASPLASLDDNTVLTMTILSDDSGAPPLGWVITVPTPNTQTFADLLVGPTPSSMLTVTGGGTAIFSAENTYSGGTAIIDGTTVEVTNSNPGVSSSIGIGALTLDEGILKAGANNLAFGNAVTLTVNGGTFDTNGNILTWNGVISGEGELTKVGAGTLILGSTNTYAGGTLVDGGTLGLAANDALGTGPVAMQPGTTLQFEASGIVVENGIALNANATVDTGSNADGISGVISGSGALTKIGSGSLILAGANTYAGGTLLDEGTLGIISNGALGSGALAMAPGTILQFEADGLTLPNAIVLNADPIVDTGSNTDTISGVISGAGSLDKIGSGTLILTAASTYTGPTDVQEGTLGLRGSLASTVTVESGATLGGTGSVGGLVANSGATVAPGVLGRYATFTVTGEASFAAGSTFAININPAGQNDKLATTGKTTLSGGTVAVSGAGGTYLPSTRYTLLTAQDGVSGTFSSLSTSGDLATLVFIDPQLSYDADDVYLGFAVKPFVSAAQTPNQAAAALALQAQPAGSPLYNALISQTAPGALSAFNALSGEVHASAVGAAFDDTRLPREAVLDRLAESYDAPSPSSAKTVQTYGFSTPTHVYSAWAQGFDSWGHLGGNGNSATVGNNIGGFILGADATLYGRYRLGVAGGYANSNISDPSRGSTGNISAAYVGLYGGASFDALQLRGGAFYANNHYGLDRIVSFPGFYQWAGSGYGGDTAEVFGEAGWRVAIAAPFVSAAAVEPFLGVAGVDLHTASFTETPGPASLIGGSENAGYGISTLGLRSEATMVVAWPMTLNAMIGWQHVYGGPTPNGTFAFASAPLTPMSIAGAPIARDALALEFGLDRRLTSNVKLSVYYSGLLSSSTSDNAIKAKLEATF
ncbi:MAG TPA: autotransporter domain-containing protein [Roseiarcus sp.]